MNKNSKISHLILSFFFLSGFCCLLYGITWTRLISLILGNSIYALIAILSAFMGGMAIGAYAGGKAVKYKANPLGLYGILEGLAGLYALVFPFLLKSTLPIVKHLFQNDPVQGSTLLVIRFLVSFALLLIPSAIFGAMLPILSKFMVNQVDHLSHKVGKLYGLNLLGAMSGCLVTGFWLIPKFGVGKTIYPAILIELIICAWTIILSKRVGQVELVEETKSTQEQFPARGYLGVVLLIMALSGFSVMIYGITWTRVITLLIGSSVYSFGLVIAAFLGGMALGNLFFAHLFDQRKDLWLVLGLFEITAGGYAFTLTPIFEKISLVMVPIVSIFSRNFVIVQGIEFFGLFFLILIPSAIFGLVFPLLIKMSNRSLQGISCDVGVLYALGSGGAAIGTVISSLIIIPALGLQKTILAAVLINIGVGSLALIFSLSLSKLKKSIAIPLIISATLALCYIQPEWNKSIIAAGSYVYAGIYSNLRNRTGQTLSEVVSGQGDLIFYKEDAHTIASVKKDKTGQVFIQLNGKTVASSQKDSDLQLLIAHLPLLIHSDPQEVMVLGLGGGQTLRAAKKYPIEHLDCLEISPAVIEASSYLNEFNDYALKDPRVKVITGDGREYLNLTQQKYDVIISQPSSPWMAGMSGMLTREFFQICKDRLKPGGLACFWLQTYNLHVSNAKSVVMAFQEIFPNLSIWEAKPGIDYLLVGSYDKIRIDYGDLKEKMSGLESELKEVNILTPEDLMARFIMNEEGAMTYTEGAAVHTDDNSFLEFQIPKSLYQETMSEQLSSLNEIRGLNCVSLLTDSWPEGFKNDLNKIFEAQKFYALGETYLLKNKQQEGVTQIKEAYLLYPQDTRIKDAYYRLLINSALSCSQKGMQDLAIRTFLLAIEVKPEGIDGHLNLGMAYLRNNDFQSAINRFQSVLQRESGNIQAMVNLGAAYLRIGDLESAIRENKAALQLESYHPEAHFNLGIAYMRSRMLTEAISEYQETIKYRPDHAEAHFNLGLAYQTSGALDQAILEYQEALRIKPDFENARKLLDRLQIMLNQNFR